MKSIAELRSAYFVQLTPMYEAAKQLENRLDNFLLELIRIELLFLMDLYDIPEQKRPTIEIGRTSFVMELKIILSCNYSRPLCEVAHDLFRTWCVVVSDSALSPEADAWHEVYHRVNEDFTTRFYPVQEDKPNKDAKEQNDSPLCGICQRPIRNNSTMATHCADCGQWVCNCDTIAVDPETREPIYGEGCCQTCGALLSQEV